MPENSSRMLAPRPGSVEIAHVLFADLVGYSLLPMDQQKEYLAELQQLVREAPQFRSAEAAGVIISLPTGDGMALAFFGDPTAPAQCALELAAKLRRTPHLKLRMGIHSGPVYRVADVNANANVAGGGINMAQRVMDCGDAGHILVSKTAADVLLQLSEWAPYLTDLGECTVKHGVTVQIWSLATAEVGNQERPGKLASAAKARPKALLTVALAVALLLVAAAGAWWLGGLGKRPQAAQNNASIVVLPFEDLSPEKNLAYLGDGIAEELQNELQKIPGLRVTGRMSSFRFRDKSEDPHVIGETLNVGTILEGSVRKQGNHAKIATQLIKAADGFQMWSDSYDKELTDIIAVQEDIARGVTENLKIRLLPKITPARKRPNAEAYNAYLQGLYFLKLYSEASLQKAVDYFEQATKLDPDYAKAWAGLAEARSGQAGQSWAPFVETFQKAREAARRALALDPDLGEAHNAMGWIQQNYEGNWAGADASYKRALELEPGNDIVISHAGIQARIVGHFDEAVKLGRRAMQIDPLNPGNYQNAGFSLYYAGLYEDARAAYLKALELQPERPLTHALLGLVYLVESRPQEALVVIEKEKHPALLLFGLALAYHGVGRKRESDENLAKLISGFSSTSYLIAEVYAFRGETDQAFKWLDQAYTQGPMPQFKGDPLLKKLWGDPRHAALLKKVGLPQ